MPRYRLNGSERAYLEGREEDLRKSYRKRPGIPDDRSTDKAELLPERFEELFQDVQLLNDAGYLDSKIWRDSRIRLFDARNHSYQDESFTYAPPRKTVTGGTSPNSSAAEKWGRRLGGTVSHQVPSLNEPHGEEARREVIWGFMQGMFQQNPHEQCTLEPVRATSQVLAERASNEIEFHDEADHRSQQNFEHSVKVGEKIHDDIERVIEEAGIVPADWMIRRTKQYLAAVFKAPLEVIDWKVTDDEHPTDEGVSQELILDIVQEYRLPQKQRLVDLLHEAPSGSNESPVKGRTVLYIRLYSRTRKPGKQTLRASRMS